MPVFRKKQVLVVVLFAMALVMFLALTVAAANPVPKYIYYENVDGALVRADFLQAEDDLFDNDSRLLEAIKNELARAITAGDQIFVECENGTFIDYRLAMQGGKTYSEAYEFLAEYEVPEQKASKELVIDSATGQPVERSILEVASLEELAAMEVAYGTVFPALNLPETVEATLNDDSTITLEVDWSEGEYDPETAGDYELAGALNLPEEISNPREIKASINVTVLPVMLTLFDQAGTYGPADEAEPETIEGDVIIMADGVTLQNYIITGDLIIAEEVGEGSVTLNNLDVKGELIVRGGGADSIIINGGEYSNIRIEYVDGKVRIVALGVTGPDGERVNVMIAEDVEGEVILEGDFDEVTIDAPGITVTFEGDSNVAQLTISENATGSIVNLSSGTAVDTVDVYASADIKGSGSVNTANIHSNDVEFEMIPDEVNVDDDVDDPVIPGPTPTPPPPQPPQTINIAPISGVTAPVTGAIPVTTVTETAQYAGTVSWSPAHGTFASDTVYTATITLTSNAGYTMVGVPEDFFTVDGATATNAENSGVVTAVFPKTDKTIDIAAIPGVAVPVTGETPVSTITETDQYTGTVSWSPAHGTFVSDTAYTATITLTPKAGFTLTGVAGDFFTIAGADTVSNTADSGVVTAVFPATDKTIDIAAIPGVAVPVTGETPVSTITETDQYTGTVSWSPAHGTFASDTAYTASITLTPKAGFTLTGVAGDFFTVAGADTASNMADSGVVTAVLPATDKTIDIAAIPGVAVPVTGETPVSTITETDQYTGTVSWSPAHGTFASDTAYTASITLTPKAGFTLTGVAGDFFTVAGADTASNMADSGVVTAVLPATDMTIDIAAIPGVTVPATGEGPVSTITETDQYTGTVSWSPDHGTFASDTAYTATITLTPKAGFTLTGVAGDFFTVAGADTASNMADSGVVTAVFPATDKTIDIAAIPGVTVPVTGEAPVSEIIETAQYTGTVTWDPADDPFGSDTVYTATITLTPKAGFTLTGVVEDFFTVDGATATNAENSGVVTAVFPATDPQYHAYKFELEDLADEYVVSAPLVDPEDGDFDGMTPVKLSIAIDEVKDTDYEGMVRVLPVGAADLQLWAKDSADDWYDINVTGWGPGDGFPIDLEAVTDVFVVAKNVFEDQEVTFKLIDISGDYGAEDNIIISQKETITAVDEVTVKNEEELDAALDNEKVKTIIVSQDITFGSSLTIDRGVTLKAAEEGIRLISDGSGDNNRIGLRSDDEIRLEGFIIETPDPLRLVSENNYVIGNTFVTNSTAISVRADDNTIEGNTIDGRAFGGEGPAESALIIRGKEDGDVVDFTLTNITIKNNTIINNDIALQFQHDDTYTDIANIVIEGNDFRTDKVILLPSAKTHANVMTVQHTSKETPVEQNDLLEYVFDEVQNNTFNDGAQLIPFDVNKNFLIGAIVVTDKGELTAALANPIVETIILGNNITVDDPIVIDDGRKVTIDLNEKDLEAHHILVKDAIVTIENGELVPDTEVTNWWDDGVDETPKYFIRTQQTPTTGSDTELYLDDVKIHATGAGASIDRQMVLIGNAMAHDGTSKTIAETNVLSVVNCDLFVPKGTNYSAYAIYTFAVNNIITGNDFNDSWRAFGVESSLDINPVITVENNDFSGMGDANAPQIWIIPFVHADDGTITINGVEVEKRDIDVAKVEGITDALSGAPGNNTFAEGNQVTVRDYETAHHSRTFGETEWDEVEVD